MSTAPAPDLLAEMERSSAERVRTARAQRSEGELYRRAMNTAPAPAVRISRTGFDLIAEVKLRAPSSGDLQGGETDIGGRVLSYARGGAAVVSILTEPTRFKGSLEHLEHGAHALRSADVPAMRKDFLVDPYQLMEARAAGAGGALLIVRMLSEERLSELLDCAAELGLFVLLEAFDGDDLSRTGVALSGRDPHKRNVWVGLNTRDLRTLDVDKSRLETLVHAFPPGWLRVAESGILDAADAAHVATLGYEMALVGTALMRAERPGRLVESFLQAGRDVLGSAKDSSRC